MTPPYRNNSNHNERLSSSSSAIRQEAESIQEPQHPQTAVHPNTKSNSNIMPRSSSKKRRRKQKQPRRLTLALSEDEYDMMLAEEEEGGTFKFHPGSKWQEPFVPGAGLLPKDPPQHGLTLYEVHRKPRMNCVPQKNNDKNASREVADDGKKRARRKTGRNGSEVVVGGSNRITCDYQNLLDEFRCVICFGTLRKTKIVRECLHRFCDTCVQTCLRRMSNSCPVCRTVIPSRRSLTVDHVYDTLIDVLGLGDSDGEEDEQDAAHIDKVVAIAASLHEASNPNTSNNPGANPMGSPASLQVAIAKKQEMILQQQQQQKEAAAEGLAEGSSSVPSSGNPQQPHSQPAQASHASSPLAEEPIPIPPLVKLYLRPHPSESETIDPLDLPYLRLAGNATIAVLESFVQAKLGLSTSQETERTGPAARGNEDSAAAPNPAAPALVDPIYFTTGLLRKPLARSMQLRLLLGAGGTAAQDAQTIVSLYYRRTKKIRRDN